MALALGAALKLYRAGAGRRHLGRSPSWTGGKVRKWRCQDLGAAVALAAEQTI
jgi:hypothetical protein